MVTVTVALTSIGPDSIGVATAASSRTAAPLLAVGVAGTRLDPVRALPDLFSALPAAVVELVVVWAWHALGRHRCCSWNCCSSGIAAAPSTST